MIKSIFSFIISVVLGCTVATPAQAQEWQFIHILDAPVINAIQRMPDGSLLAENLYNFYRSTDEGQSWRVMRFDMTFPQFDDEGHLYGNSKNRTYRSTDGGVTFQTVLDSGQLRVDRTGTFYINEAGIWKRSSDEGKSWEDFERQPPRLRLTQEGYWMTSKQSNRDSILFSTDQGRSWTAIAAATEFSLQDFSNIGIDRFYYLADSSLYCTTNAGATWDTIRDERFVSLGSRLPLVNEDTIFVQAAGATLRSLDHGISWTALPRVGRLFMTHDGSVWGHAVEGFSKLVNDKWVPRFKGLDAQVVHDILLSQNDTITALESYSVIPISEHLSDPPARQRPVQYIYDIGKAGDNLYVRYGSRTFRSQDNGHSWDTLQNNFGLPVHGVFFSHQQAQARYSTDEGVTWSEMTLPREFTFTAHLMPLPQSGSFILVGKDSVYITSNGGTEWIARSMPSIDNRLPVTVTQSFWVVRSQDSLLTTDDEGLTWHKRLHLGEGYATDPTTDGSDNQVMAIDSVLYQWSYDQHAWLAFDTSRAHRVSTLEFHPAGDLLIGTARGGLFSRKYPTRLPRSTVHASAVPRQGVMYVDGDELLVGDHHGTLSVTDVLGRTVRVQRVFGNERIPIPELVSERLFVNIRDNFGERSLNLIYRTNAR